VTDQDEQHQVDLSETEGVTENDQRDQDDAQAGERSEPASVRPDEARHGGLSMDGRGFCGSYGSGT
jgi:hypothetical protein